MYEIQEGARAPPRLPPFAPLAAMLLSKRILYFIFLNFPLFQIPVWEFGPRYKQ